MIKKCKLFKNIQEQQLNTAINKSKMSEQFQSSKASIYTISKLKIVQIREGNHFFEVN